LTGGAGTDVLALIGTGTFGIDQLAAFTGFEKITLDNATNTFASLTLGSQPIEVDATGYAQFFVNSPSNWNGSDIINADASRSSYLYFGNSSPTFPPPPVTYDLTSNTFSNVSSASSSSNNVTLLINSSDTAGIQSFTAFGSSDNLVTGAATLDLSNTTVSGFRVSSTNGLGTTFTVKDLGTALQIAGGPGHDTLIAQGFTLTANQRVEIFAINSIETITDQSGTYTASPPSAPPTVSVRSDQSAMRGQVIALSVMVTISDPGGVGYVKLELWDSNGTTTGGQFVVNGTPQTGGHEIDVSPSDVANTMFDVGTLGGTDTLWARLLQDDSTLTGWQQFSVTAPIAQLPTLTVSSDASATRGQQIALSNLLSITDPDGVGYQKLELWDSNGTVARGQFVLNGTAQTGGHEIDVSPTDVANTVFDVGMLGGTDILWARLQESDGTLTGWQPFTVTAPTYTFMVIDPSSSIGTLATGINNVGQIVGYYGDSTGGHGFLYSGAVYTIIDYPLAGGTNAYGINDAGQIVGYYSDGSTGQTHGFLDSAGTYTLIDPPGSEWTEVYGINNAGQIVGQYQDSSGHQLGFRYSDGTYSVLNDSLATTSGTLPIGINNMGQMLILR
jgi:probable HAF family extracellular repeat protein